MGYDAVSRREGHYMQKFNLKLKLTNVASQQNSCPAPVKEDGK